MAYGNYHAVDITVTAEGANTFSFRAEPFDECSGGSGKIRVNRGKIENLMHAKTIDSLCRFILDALDMDEELERAGKSELLEQMPLPEILELLDGSERLGDVFTVCRGHGTGHFLRRTGQNSFFQRNRLFLGVCGV